MMGAGSWGGLGSPEGHADPHLQHQPDLAAPSAAGSAAQPPLLPGAGPLPGMCWLFLLLFPLPLCLGFCAYVLAVVQPEARTAELCSMRAWAEGEC